MLKGQAELDRFIESLRADKKSENTIELYKLVIRKMLKDINKEPGEITREDLENYKMEIIKQKGQGSSYKANTLISYIAAWKSFFKYIETNAADKLTKPKKPKILPDILTENEMTRILTVAKNEDPMDYAMISIMFYGGLRLSETMNLDIEDINYENGTIRIRKGKGNKDGVICIHKDALESIKAYLPHRRTPIKNTNALFITPRRHRRPSKHYVGRRVKQYAVKAGITKRVYPHLFRHTLGSCMAEHGASLLDIKEQLRHENISTTTIYAHISKEKVKKTYDATVPSLIFKKQEYPNKPLETINQELTMSSKQKLELLETRFLEGKISEETYKMLKAKYTEPTTSVELEKTTQAQKNFDNRGYA